MPVFTIDPLDKPMLIIILLLVAFGSIMVFSASYAYAYSRYGDSTYFIKKQLLWVVFGLIAMLLVSHIYYKIIKVFSLPIYGVALVLLGLVLVIGVAAQSAQRWIYIGPFSLQPSEIMKFALVLAMAWYGDVYKKKIHDPTQSFKQRTVNSLLKPAIFIVVAAGAIMLENHVSGTLIVCLIGAICLWALGCDKKWFLSLGGAAFLLVGVILLIVWFKDAAWNKIDELIPAYVVKRIDMWLRPENYTLLDDTWQTVQGKYAVGSGGFFGAGFGQSYQKHLFVSQPQNDFIFAIVCEELGFVGAIGLILLYLVFVYRGLVIARRAPDVYASIVATGIVGHVGIQAFLNMLVVTGVFPNTGISLPFISYGGSSLVMLMAEMGILLSISRASTLEK
ncbi:MAG: FtsW/RodA/SpoVE family cell cycle protein [Clostridia bacterium]|nr:FtsW/RodA/SpoVE family cell cycle protein [Clostridia bacterium]